MTVRTQKLTNEQIEQKIIDVDRLGLDLEIAKVKRKWIADKLKGDFLIREAKLNLVGLDKEIKRQDRNISAVREQIKTGEVSM